MDLDELQSVRDRERQTDKLQQLRTSFYADAGEFIQDLRDRRKRAAKQADDPFDAPEVSRLSDEIDTAEQTVEAIYEKRVGKIVKAASFAAADLPTEVDGMTAEEETLFDSLVGDIKENRQHVLDVLAGETDGVGPLDETSGSTEETTGKPDETDDQSNHHESAFETERATESQSSDTPESEVAAADLMGTDDRTPAESPTSERADEEAANEDVASRDIVDKEVTDRSETDKDATTETGPPVRNDGGTATVDREAVRITDDVGAILGVDQREYDLSRDDVVTLPSANAEPLVERDAATRLD